VKHPHFGRTATGKPVHLHTHDYHPSEHWYDRVNKRVAIFTTKIVGTMWCAYVFAAFDCLALPTALHQGLYGIVQWVASFFLQLVLLSVIMVGQNLQSTAADARAEKQFQDTETVVDRLDLDTQGGLQVIEDHLKKIEALIRGG
jgi:amino acid transporter